MYVTCSSCFGEPPCRFGPSASKNPDDGRGASVCLRRRVDPGANLRSLSEVLGKTLEMLIRDSELRRCPLEPRLISLASWPSFTETLLLNSGFEALTKESRVCEGVKGGPRSGTWTRRKAS